MTGSSSEKEQMPVIKGSRRLKKAHWIAIGCAILVPSAAHGGIRWLKLSEIPVTVRKAPGYDRKVNMCSLHLYSKDADTKGTNIRAAPSINAPVIGVIPGERAEATARIGPEFHVIGSQNGWLLIHNAYWAGYDYGKKLLFRGPGWIAAGLVGFEIEDDWLYDAPHAGAQKILKLSAPNDTPWESNWGPSSVSIKRVYGCSGSFVEVDLETPNRQKAHGWVTNLCGNQVTTCASNSGFFIEERNGTLVGSWVDDEGKPHIGGDEE